MDKSLIKATTSTTSQITDFLEKNPIILQLMRFAAIGLLNTAVNFLVLNIISKGLKVDAGTKLGYVSGVAFAFATLQSYFWNKHWAFGEEQGITLLKNLTRLIYVGTLGALAIVFVLLGSKVSLSAYYYATLLIFYIIGEIIVWKSLKFGRKINTEQNKHFLLFILVSFIGLIINVIVISVASQHIYLSHSVDLNKNISNILATLVALVWNFIGYKLIVFKK